MRTALITGVSSGIGKATAFEMASRGYRVIGAGRSAERTEPVVDAINEGGGSATFLEMDLASFNSVRSAARAFLASGEELDVFIANAAVGGVRGLTEDGFEIHFGVNHLGHFLLYHGLMGSIGKGGRVVIVSSDAHRWARGFDHERIRTKTRIRNMWSDYGVSKLANVLFGKHLADTRQDVRVASVHPGLAKTNIFPAVAKPFFPGKRTAEVAADTVVYCATAEDLDGPSGAYYVDRNLREPSREARDGRLAATLWDQSIEWCGLATR